MDLTFAADRSPAGSEHESQIQNRGASVLRDRDFVQESASAENKFNPSVAGSLHPMGDTGRTSLRAGSGDCDTATGGQFFPAIEAANYNTRAQAKKPRSIPECCSARIMATTSRPRNRGRASRFRRNNDDGLCRTGMQRAHSG
jgi:hypothetical protein